MQHFKMFAESLLMLAHRDKFSALLIGCQDDSWPEIESQLHSDLKQKLRGRFPIDVVSATPEEVRQHATRILTESMLTSQRELISEVMGEAQRNARGAVGLKHVLNALERQEVDCANYDLVGTDYDPDRFRAERRTVLRRPFLFRGC